MNIRINGRSVEVKPEMTLAVAIALARVPAFAPLCAMGICYECRATIDGVPHRRSCLVPCHDGMEVRTDDI
jgi:aerobic-type carbon monoxide dehydrogenase small subunit (CoxS/CutS family)